MLLSRHLRIVNLYSMLELIAVSAVVIPGKFAYVSVSELSLTFIVANTSVRSAIHCKSVHSAKVLGNKLYVLPALHTCFPYLSQDLIMERLRCNTVPAHTFYSLLINFHGLIANATVMHRSVFRCTRRCSTLYWK